MDKNLRDDMLKLVRYKVLFVKREYEHSFPEREDLVSDNMDGSAFTAWKVAEFIQELGRGETTVPRRWQEKSYPQGEYVRDGKLMGLKEEDKKYLRVYYEVLERYPRQKFKFEEKQIRVLEQIRDVLPKKGRKSGNGASAGAAGAARPAPASSPAQADPYDELLNRLVISKDTFAMWRQNFARCSRRLGHDIANAFNAHRLIGTFPAPEITAEEVRAALHQVKQPFNRESFDRFTGAALGDLRIYAPQPPPAPPLELAAPPVHSIWGVTKEADGRFIQRITGSNKDYVSPEDVPKLKKHIAESNVDLTLNEYTEELGAVSWASYYQNHSNQLRAIACEMNGRLLWINQIMDPDMRPTLGPLAIGSVGGQPFIVIEDQFILSIDWAEVINGKLCFCVYAMHLNFDFRRCSAVPAGRILKMRNEVVDR